MTQWIGSRPVKLALAASAVVCGLAATSVYFDQPALHNRAFSWNTYLPARPASSYARDWPALAREGPLKTQMALEDALRTNTIQRASLAGFRAVIDEPTTLVRIQNRLAKLDSPEHKRAIAGLYADLMSAQASPDILLAKLTDTLGRMFQLIPQRAPDDGRHVGWAVSINIYAALLAYQRSGDTRFIELASTSLSKVLDLRDDRRGRKDQIRGRIMKGWGGTRYAPDGQYMTNITLTGRASFVLLLFADIVRQNPPHLARHRATADRFLNAARESMDDYAKEFVTSGDSGYYIRPARNDIEPLNHMAWAGNALILLNEHTGAAKYRRMAEQLARYFKSRMTFDAGMVSWPYQADRDGTPRGIEYVWKARTTSQFMIFAWQRGLVFTDHDMRALAETIANNVFRSDGRMNARLDSTFLDMAQFRRFRGNYLAVTPFIVLDCVEPAVRTRIERMVAERPDIGGWLRKNHGVVAYAYRLGGSVSASRCASTAARG